MTFIPDEDDRLWRESQQEGWFRFSTPFRYVVFLVVLILLLIGLWYLFSPTQQSYDKTNVALIRADETPFKVKAEDQGVPSVKHQDKLVYGRIRGDQIEPAVEHILPDPEPPLPQLKNNSSPLKMVEQYAPEDGDVEKGMEVSPKDSSSITSIEDLIEENVSEKKTGVKKKEGNGHILVQLGSLKSYDIAESEWARLSKKHKDILGECEPSIQKVDLGADQGVYYRLRIGPFESVEKAQDVCASLKERKVECLVIH